MSTYRINFLEERNQFDITGIHNKNLVLLLKKHIGDVFFQVIMQCLKNVMKTSELLILSFIILYFYWDWEQTI